MNDSEYLTLVFAIGIILGIVVGVFVSNLNQTQPSCNYDCPQSPIVDCGNDKKPYVNFTYGDDITLFNDYYEVTNREFIDVAEYAGFDIRINNNATLQNKTLCMEYRYFDEIRIDEINQVPSPDYLIIKKDYRVDCWQLPEMQRYDRLKYKMEIRQGSKIGEQEVKIWTQAK